MLTLVLTSYAVGAALLALWWIARFPSVGPHRVVGVLLAMVAAAVVMAIGNPLLGRVALVGRYGPLLALVAVFLPVLTIAFWAAACALRVLARSLRP